MRLGARHVAVALVLAAVLLTTAYYSLSGGSSENVIIRVYADRTLQKPLEEVVASFINDQCSRCRVVWVWGSSGYTLSRLSIDGGGDLYVADDSHFPVKGVDEGLLEPGSLAVVGYIRLTLIVKEGNPKNVSSLVDALQRPDIVIAVGNPEHVSAGVLARRVFEEAGLASLVDGLVREGRVKYASSAAEAASWVRMGLADVAVTFNVYATLWPEELDEVSDPLLVGVKAPVVVALPSSHGPLAEELYKYVVSHAYVFLEIWGGAP